MIPWMEVTHCKGAEFFQVLQYMYMRKRCYTECLDGYTGQALHYVRGQLDKRKRKDLLLSSNGDPFINRVLGRTILCFTYGGLL